MLAPLPMPNRLADAHSPYLLQHADNPVDWYPWGEEAFEKARREDKPIFLSVGYATCHWCHVMERESFEDDDVARLLNEHFVPIKVDREERPDVDALYMSVTQALTGHGGWPMTVLLTPEREPFFAGTYFPKHGRSGRPGMMDLLPNVARSWTEDRERVDDSAAQITEAVREALSRPGSGAALGEDVLAAAYNGLAGRFDPEAGGFGGAPKFPTPHNLLFLLREAQRVGGAETLPAGAGQAVGQRALQMVEETLGAMRRGGIYDHVGFGFHRYSTDRVWKLPHFEKMLYDQALLAMAYTEAFEVTRDPAYRRTAEEIFAYLDRDLTNPEGAFYSAEDADSENAEGEKEEGAFYVWHWSEFMQALGERNGVIAAALFNVDREGNFRDEATRELTGANVLFRTVDDAEAAERLEVAEEVFRQRIDEIRGELFAVRNRRPRPLLDDKVLTDWNGLMIAALAKAARAFGDETYAQRAASAADFFLETMRTEDGRLLHRYRNGHAGIPGLLDDYAFLVWGLIELYQATFETDYLRAALDLNATMRRHFEDPTHGGFFLSADDAEALLLRQKEYYDGAVPSGNAVAALNNLRLARLTGQTELEDLAERTMRSAGEIAQQPMAHTLMMCAAAFAAGPAQEVTIVGDPEAADTRALLDVVRERYLPNAVVHLRPPDGGAVAELAPYTEAQTMRDGQATAYVCEGFACQAPTTNPEEVVRQLDKSQG